ncbi:helix-turn-helix domain-containing protein [Nocardia vulneris]|uniref:HTH cro/C1-type domain-containing protein n=1 Tax=Nocardia vulneris TaxID=1141657 RepID=A0ABR4ZCW7_9NOCA|nr:helix-turn-helix transcriptional regulator [Nocardia vulneris]KIA62984.1 hypothetical protein FG87_21605 [Nocardia vulneris]
MIENDSVGARIKRYAKLRGLTYEQLAQKSGVSLSMIKQSTSGHASPSRFILGKLALALQIDAAKFDVADDLEQLETLDIVPILRRTLAATDLMDDDLEPEPVDQLRPLVAKVGQWRRATNYKKIGEVLPGLVDRLLIAGQVEGEPAYALLTDAYRAANSLAHKMGYNDLSMTATERMVWAATLSGDPLRLAIVQDLKAATLTRIGAGKQAMRLLIRAMSDIEDLVGSDPTAAAVYSVLHMRAGTISATMGDADTSRDHLAEAEALAQRFPEGVVYETVVGETNVALYRLAAHNDLGDVGQALEIANGTHIPEGMAKERTSYFWLDSARAHLAAGDLDAAEEALLESRAIAPQHWRSSPAAKAAVRAVADRQRYRSDTLRSLANSCGILD